MSLCEVKTENGNRNGGQRVSGGSPLHCVDIPKSHLHAYAIVLTSFARIKPLRHGRASEFPAGGLKNAAQNAPHKWNTKGPVTWYKHTLLRYENMPRVSVARDKIEFGT